MKQQEGKSFILLDPTKWQEEETEAGIRHTLSLDAVDIRPKMLIADATVAVQTLFWADGTAKFRLLVGWPGSQPGELTIFMENDPGSFQHQITGVAFGPNFRTPEEALNYLVENDTNPR